MPIQISIKSPFNPERLWSNWWYFNIYTFISLPYNHFNLDFMQICEIFTHKNEAKLLAEGKPCVNFHYWTPKMSGKSSDLLEPRQNLPTSARSSLANRCRADSILNLKLIWKMSLWIFFFSKCHWVTHLQVQQLTLSLFCFPWVLKTTGFNTFCQK